MPAGRKFYPSGKDKYFISLIILAILVSIAFGPWHQTVALTLGLLTYVLNIIRKRRRLTNDNGRE